ncbi:MAG: tetratricopeptide repeat protein [Candidatus Sumerlaeia bacterium]
MMGTLRKALVLSGIILALTTAVSGQDDGIDVRVEEGEEGRPKKVEMFIRPIQPELALPRDLSTTETQKRKQIFSKYIEEELAGGAEEGETTPTLAADEEATHTLVMGSAEVAAESTSPTEKADLSLPGDMTESEDPAFQEAYKKLLEKYGKEEKEQADLETPADKKADKKVVDIQDPDGQAVVVYEGETDETEETSAAAEEALAGKIPLTEDEAASDMVRKAKLVEMALRIQSLPPNTKPEYLPEKLEKAIGEKYGRIQDKIERGRKSEAQRELYQLAADFPNSSHAPKALFEASQLERRDITRRINGFVQVVEEHPLSPYAVQSLLEIGNARYLQGDYEGALDAYRAYQIRQGKGFNQAPLRVKITRCLMQVRRYEDALQEIERLLADYPASRSADQWLDMQSECQMALMRFPEAVLTLRNLQYQYPNYPLRPKIMLALGLCYEEIDQDNAARQVYKEIRRAYPPGRSDTPFETSAAGERLESMEDPLFYGARKPRPTPPPQSNAPEGDDTQNRLSVDNKGGAISDKALAPIDMNAPLPDDYVPSGRPGKARSGGSVISSDEAPDILKTP